MSSLSAAYLISAHTDCLARMHVLAFNLPPPCACQWVGHDHEHAGLVYAHRLQGAPYDGHANLCVTCMDPACPSTSLLQWKTYVESNVDGGKEAVRAFFQTLILTDDITTAYYARALRLLDENPFFGGGNPILPHVSLRLRGLEAPDQRANPTVVIANGYPRLHTKRDDAESFADAQKPQHLDPILVHAVDAVAAPAQTM